MSETGYDWKRFWCPRSGSIKLADDGYLYDPDAEGKAYNPDLVSLEAIAHLPCLALLGEPGIGKTRALKAEQDEIANKIQEQGNQALFLDLRSYGSEERLVHELFNNPKFTAWQAHTHQLHIFLDSFDECLLRIDTLAMLLVDKLKEYRSSVQRLYLRIACRTAVWSIALEKGLKEIWGENHVGVYELAPLRRVDVSKAANGKGFPADNFLKEIEHKDIVPLAIKPITLKFLLNIYHRHNGQFPPGQKLYELYLEGCKLLCEEVNESYQASNRAGNFDSDQRLIVAARIAAVTIFANRFAVWTGVDQGEVPAEDVLLKRLRFGCEKANGREFEVTREALKEVLDTGLFSSRGSNRMGWAHQTYAEFLAAWYLEQHEVPLKQIRQLIFSSEDPDRKLVPQLHETAAWLASMRLDVLQEIVKTDPDVLLRTDVPTDAGVRTSIVDNLLTQYEEGKLFDRGRNNYRHYAKLKHPGLVEQLRPYICDSSKQINARDLAIDIAEVCEVSELQDELVNLALDSLQSIYLRVSAAKAISLVGNAITRLKLKLLAIKQLPEDEDDRLKGYALQALWSGQLTAEELFQALTPPKKINFFGSYQWFLNHKLVPQLQPDNLVVALNWLGGQGLRCSGHPFEKLGDAILFKAWENFDLPGVAESFTQVALVQWREHQRIITHDSKMKEQLAASLLQDSRKRRTLIKQAVSIVAGVEEDPFFLISSLTENVLVSEDIYWMLESLHGSNCEKVQKIWAQLIQWSFNRQDAKQIDAIIAATQVNRILQEIFAPYSSSIELDSAQANQLKSNYLRMQEMQDRRRNPPLLDPPPKEIVLQRLEKLEAGDLNAWWQLNMEMTLKPDSTHYGSDFELDLTELPGWQEADEATQRRIIEGAKKYIQQQDDIDYRWIGTNTFNRPALAGYRALQLLLQESSVFFQNLPSKIWQRWAPVIIAAPNQDQDSYLELVKYAYLNAPEEFIKTLITLINKENQEHDYLSVINRLDKCWDKRLKLTLLEKAKDPSLKPKCIGQLLEKLLEQGLTEARDFAQSLLTFPLPLAENEREKALIAAKVLVENSDPLSWSFIWALVQQDSSFGREVFERVDYDYFHGIQLNLTEAQLANLYIWLVRQYPYYEDPDLSDPEDSVITPRKMIVDLKRIVLNQLTEKGTHQACAEIERIIQELPDITQLKRILIEAQANMRRNTWQPPKPKEFLQLVFNQDKRLVQSAQHLLEVLIESLERLDLELQGETPAVRDLWDKAVDTNCFRPLDENAFSDYVKRFLDRDLRSRGIIVNREVELRRSYGGNPGERTDIHVDAVLKRSNGEIYDSITAIIEVKGCWYREIHTAMQTQLVQRYLADNACSYGLYLVGWFYCQQWDDKDSRRSQTPRISLEEARKQFSEQAKELSSSGNVVCAYVLNTALR
jgi:predicted NACHT family NTPase